MQPSALQQAMRQAPSETASCTAERGEPTRSVRGRGRKREGGQERPEVAVVDGVGVGEAVVVGVGVWLDDAVIDDVREEDGEDDGVKEDDAVREDEEPSECVDDGEDEVVGEDVGEGVGITNVHVGRPPTRGKASIDVVKTAVPAASSSCTVSPMSRFVQQSARPQTSIEATTQGAGSVICTHGDESPLAECHMLS